MGKSVFIAEKPSVAQEFAKALHINTKRKDGYLESDEAIVTWCVGHLVTMSYPEVYDEKYKADCAQRPMARLGAPIDVAMCVFFLCSDMAPWVTGSSLVVDGGGIA